MNTTLNTTLARPLSQADGLQADLRNALHAAGYASLRRIEVSIRPEAVVLRGRVPTWHLKQVAQTVALNVTGLRRLVNELRVDSD